MRHGGSCVEQKRLSTSAAALSDLFIYVLTATATHDDVIMTSDRAFIIVSGRRLMTADKWQQHEETDDVANFVNEATCLRLLGATQPYSRRVCLLSSFHHSLPCSSAGRVPWMSICCCARCCCTTLC